eukprot:gene8918-10450_t
MNTPESKKKLPFDKPLDINTAYEAFKEYAKDQEPKPDYVRISKKNGEITIYKFHNHFAISQITLSEPDGTIYQPRHDGTKQLIEYLYKKEQLTSSSTKASDRNLQQIQQQEQEQQEQEQQEQQQEQQEQQEKQEEQQQQNEIDLKNMTLEDVEQQEQQQEQEEKEPYKQQEQQQQRKEFEIDFKDLTFGEVIGKGYFGQVTRGRWNETEVAIKTIYRQEFKTKTIVEMFQREVSVLSILRHPNIVQFLGASTVGPKEQQCIVLEWMDGGTLHQYLFEKFHYLESNPHIRLKMALEIANGMYYLHSRTPAILHRDLSSSNILLDSKSTDFKCKISDFGLSRPKEQAMTCTIGGQLYMAPEVFKGESNSEKSDVYSFAILLWEILTSQNPQQDMEPQKMAHMAAHDSYRPPIPATVSTEWKELLQMCWHQECDKRPTFEQVVGLLKEMAKTAPTSNGSSSVSNLDIGVYAS